MLFIVAEVVFLSFKYKKMPFPFGNFISEFFLLFLVALLECISVHTGKKGNLTNKLIFLVVNFLLHIPSMLSLVYLMLWQTYILRLEMLLISTALGFHAFEIMLGIAVAIHINRSIV